MANLWSVWFCIFCLSKSVLSFRFHSKVSLYSSTKTPVSLISSPSQQKTFPVSFWSKTLQKSRFFSVASNDKNTNNRHDVKESLLRQAKHAFFTASITPITPDSFQQWLQATQSFTSSLDKHKIDLELLRELYAMSLDILPLDTMDLLHLATIDQINGKVLETLFQAYQSRTSFSLREFVDELNDAHLSFIDSLFNQNDDNYNRNDDKWRNKKAKMTTDLDDEQLCQRLFLIFERLFLALNDFQFLDVSRHSPVSQQRVQNWLSPLEARLTRRVSSFVMGSSLSRSEHTRSVALQQMLKRLSFQLPLMCRDTSQGSSDQFQAAELTSFVATLLRHTTDISDDTSFHDTRDTCYLETRKTLAAHLSPLLLPATHLRHTFKTWQDTSPSLIPPLRVWDTLETHCVALDELHLIPEGVCHRLLSRDTESQNRFNFTNVAQQWLTVSQECVAATLLSWQLRHSFTIMKPTENDPELQENETVEQLRTKFGDFSRDKRQNEGTKERLDAVEKRFEQKQLQDTDNEQSYATVSRHNNKPLTPAEKLKRLPLLTATQSPFVPRHDETPVSRSLLTRAMLSLPPDTRDTVSFALKSRFKKLGVSQSLRHTVDSDDTMNTENEEENDLFVSLQRQLVSRHTFLHHKNDDKDNDNHNLSHEKDDKDSVFSDMSRLNVIQWYNADNNVKNNVHVEVAGHSDDTCDTGPEKPSVSLSFETQLAVALLYNLALKEEANFKFRALNLYDNSEGLTKTVNSDAQFECNLAVVLLDYLAAPLCLSTSHSQESALDDVFLKRLVSQSVLDPVLATHHPTLSATQVLSETACVATLSLVNYLLATPGDTEESVSRAVVDSVSQRLRKAETAVRHMFEDDDTLINTQTSEKWRHSVLRTVTQRLARDVSSKSRDTPATQTYQEKVARLQRLCRDTLSRLFGVSSDVSENLFMTHLVTQYDTRVTTLLLDNIATPRDTSFVRQLGHTMETQLLCLAPVSHSQSDKIVETGDNTSIVSQFRKRVALLTAQIVTQLLNIATRDFLSGHTQKLSLVRHRCVSLLRHPLLTHIFHSETGVSRRYVLQLVTQLLSQQDTPSSSSVSRHSKASSTLVDVSRCVEAMMRHRGRDTGAIADGWVGTPRDTSPDNNAKLADESEATDIFSELQQLLLETYATHIAL